MNLKQLNWRQKIKTEPMRHTLHVRTLHREKVRKEVLKNKKKNSSYSMNDWLEEAITEKLYGK